MPDTNPFSAGEQSDEHEEVALVQSDEKVKIADSDEESIATETSTNSAPKGPVVTSNGEIKSDSKEESKLKKILAKKAQERIASEQGLKAKIIKKLDEKFPEPPSPQKVRCSFIHPKYKFLLIRKVNHVFLGFRQFIWSNPSSNPEQDRALEERSSTKSECC